MSTPPIILIVDDDSSHRAMLRTVLRGWGYATDEADDGDTAVEKVKERAYDAVLSDVRMARMDGISAIREILHHNPSIPVLVMTAWQSVETAVAALRLGAYDYLEKPLDFDLLHLTLERALDHTRLAAENRELREYIRESPSGLLGRSPRMRELIEMVNTVAPTEATVLITGESGTGKERVARAIQEASARRGKAFVTVNCAALNESLLESELFGHEKGAFTGADKRREGRFSQADGGTLFLDEIGELPLLLQAKLLRALQQGEVQRVGSDTPIIVDVRVIAATNRNLREEVSEGRFREDLYYRLSAFSVELPPLRSCPEDVCFLIDRLMEKIPQKYGVPPRSLSGEAFGKLLAYNWPGNIRELENVLENAVALSESELIYAEHIHLEGTAPAPLTLKERLKREERQILRQTLAQCGGSRVKAMELLGLSKTVFYGKLKEYQLD